MFILAKIGRVSWALRKEARKRRKSARVQEKKKKKRARF